MDMFDHLLKATKDSGDMLGIQYGIVADVNDPLGIGRIQVYDQAKGGKHKSNWLIRGLPFTNFTPPVPKLDELVVFGYIMGDPHQGCYLGVVVNNNNKPVGSDNDFTIVLGNTKFEILENGTVTLTGSQDITIKAAKNVVVEAAQDVRVKATKVTIEASQQLTFNTPKVDFGAPSTVTISGKNVATVGAVDSNGETIVNKGW